MERVKKIIINHDVGMDDYSFFGTFKGELIINSIICSAKFSRMGKIIRFNIDFNDLPNKSDWISKEKRLISFNSTGGEQTTYAFLMPIEDLLPKPENPTKEGYVFAGWYTDENYGTEWNFEEDLVTENMTLYAGWIKN